MFENESEKPENIGDSSRERGNYITLVVALVGIFGVILGATAQYFYSVKIEETKEFRDLRSKSYVHFINAIGGIAMAQRNNNKERELEADITLADAKARIAIYGSKAVADAVSVFFKKYGALDSDAAMDSFTRMIQTMRSETIGGKESISDADIQRLLFDRDVGNPAMPTGK